ncbi:MAG: hypothetical protein NVSMB33_17900 [Ktedonobacteraceae bacterium]
MSFTDMAIQVLLSIILGICFLAAALPKLRHPKGFVLAVLEYHVLPFRLSRVYARLLPPLECLLGLLLLSGIAVRSAAIVLSLLVLSFIMGVGINLGRGRTLECHCFGKTTKRMIGWKLLLEDIALLCATIALTIFASKWVALEPWSIFRFIGLVQAESIGPLLGCVVVTVCISTLLSKSSYNKGLYEGTQLRRK